MFSSRYRRENTKSSIHRTAPVLRSPTTDRTNQVRVTITVKSHHPNHQPLPQLNPLDTKNPKRISPSRSSLSTPAVNRSAQAVPRTRTWPFCDTFTRHSRSDERSRTASRTRQKRVRNRDRQQTVLHHLVRWRSRPDPVVRKLWSLYLGDTHEV